MYDYECTFAVFNRLHFHNAYAKSIRKITAEVS